jgi:hypothetical protein
MMCASFIGPAELLGAGFIQVVSGIYSEPEIELGQLELFGGWGREWLSA